MKMTKIKKEKPVEQDLKEITSDLLNRLGIEGSVGIEEGEDDHFKVNIQTDETGLLIGWHGETLNSLQLLIGVILYKKLGKWTRLVLDVGGYRKAREESIKEMVGRIATEVETTGSTVTLPYLTPLERRIVHLMLSDNPKVVSESLGEGRDRRVNIKLRK